MKILVLIWKIKTNEITLKEFKEQIIYRTKFCEKRRNEKNLAEIKKAERILNHLEKHKNKTFQSKNWWDNWINAKNIYDKLNNRKFRNIADSIKLNWRETGEKPSNFFFKKFKARRNNSNLDKILLKDGSTTDNPREIKEDVQRYYLNLFKEDKINLNHCKTF